jgi:hypothetical protein
MLGVTEKFFSFTDRIHLATTVELSEAALAADAESIGLCGIEGWGRPISGHQVSELQKIPAVERNAFYRV